MATDANAVRAAQAGKTVTTTDGYEITYDENGFAKRSVAPDGSVKFYDSLGNQTSTPPVQTETTTEQRVITPGSSTDPGSVDSLPTTVLPSGEVAVVVNMGESAPDGKAQETVKSDDPAAKTADSATPATEKVEGQKTPSTPTDLSAADVSAHGPAYDDDGNLQPGWVLDEENNPRWQGGTVVETATANSAAASRKLAQESAAKPTVAPKSITPIQKDWRVRMSLAPSANYLYNAAKDDPSHILYPLYNTKGVIFPYTPTIQTGYRATYEPADIPHTNYKSYFYKNSSVDDVTITADFTAQDSEEASYLLAVIHFFKSATKMFYGQDKEPRAGTPPPLIYLSGFGAYQFDNHPMVISSFTYALPNDVDYVRTATKASYATASASAKPKAATDNSIMGMIKSRLGSLKRGGGKDSVNGMNAFNYLSSNDATYVPSKIQLTITGYPIVSRKDISNRFSLDDYASGILTRGSTKGNNGIW